MVALRMKIFPLTTNPLAENAVLLTGPPFNRPPWASPLRDTVLEAQLQPMVTEIRPLAEVRGRPVEGAVL
jgi:hypothetical protein